MLSVEEAIQRIERTFSPLGAETVALDQGLGRVLAEALEARLTQPPADVSAMDGYAVRVADVETLPATLKIVQRIAAGQPPSGAISTGEAAHQQVARILLVRLALVGAADQAESHWNHFKANARDGVEQADLRHGTAE